MNINLIIESISKRPNHLLKWNLTSSIQIYVIVSARRIKGLMIQTNKHMRKITISIIYRSGTRPLKN